MIMLQLINICLEVSGGILSFIIILSQIFNDNVKKRHEKILLYLLCSNMISLFSDAAAWGWKGLADDISIRIVHIANFITYVTGYLLLFFYTLYFTQFFKAHVNTKLLVRAIAGIMVISVSLTIISQWNHMYYIIDENNIYHRQSLFWLSQIWGILGTFLNTTFTIYHRKALRKQEYIAFLCYNILPLFAILLQICLYGVALLNITTTTCILIVYFITQINQAQQRKERELEIEKSKMAILISQVQPHFLYNCLTSISRLCDSDSKQAKEAILIFATYLRGNLNALTMHETISFKEELHHVDLYLSLQKMRYDNFLHISHDIQTMDFMIPPLALQILVENAVVHGLAKKPNGGTLQIIVKNTPQCIQIIVKDNGIGFNIGEVMQEEGHVGLRNIAMRLKLLCNGTIQIKSILDEGSEITIQLPKS